MIIDVHSHAWEYPAHFSDDFRQQAKRAKAGVEMDLTVRYADYPFTNVNGTVEGLRTLNNMLAGTLLPRHNSEAIDAMI